MTPSDDIILLSRFSKFYYKHYQEGSFSVDKLAHLMDSLKCPFHTHVEAYVFLPFFQLLVYTSSANFYLEALFES
ncbi:hypothetical protein SUGI_0167170 [Cryptomeria japonica]|nr:hypothetical protein SUGI_0167170 [Cryptomeria japonica]